MSFEIRKIPGTENDDFSEEEYISDDETSEYSVAEDYSDDDSDSEDEEFGDVSSVGIMSFQSPMPGSNQIVESQTTSAGQPMQTFSPVQPVIQISPPVQQMAGLNIQISPPVQPMTSPNIQILSPSQSMVNPSIQTMPTSSVIEPIQLNIQPQQPISLNVVPETQQIGPVGILSGGGIKLPMQESRDVQPAQVFQQSTQIVSATTRQRKKQTEPTVTVPAYQPPVFQTPTLSAPSQHPLPTVNVLDKSPGESDSEYERRIQLINYVKTAYNTTLEDADTLARIRNNVDIHGVTYSDEVMTYINNVLPVR